MLFRSSTALSLDSTSSQSTHSWLCCMTFGLLAWGVGGSLQDPPITCQTCSPCRVGVLAQWWHLEALLSFGIFSTRLSWIFPHPSLHGALLSPVPPSVLWAPSSQAPSLVRLLWSDLYASLQSLCISSLVPANKIQSWIFTHSPDGSPRTCQQSL